MNAFEFEIIKPAHRSTGSGCAWDEGYLVKYDGDIYFVYDPNNRLNIKDYDFWFQIERAFCVDEYDPEDRYYEADGFCRRLVLPEVEQ